jgi:hypothetical protein
MALSFVLVRLFAQSHCTGSGTHAVPARVARKSILAIGWLIKI